MRRYLLIIAAIFIALVLVAPMPKFDKPTSTVVEASDGTLLGARIASDGQWRFPAPKTLPDKYVTALINYEDRYFRFHPGINIFSIFNAFIDNIKAKRVVRGGSTITMQVARLARDNPPRTYRGKIIEMLSALKLELFKSKNKILLMYAANAPFGGNTVGIDAAIWRYTGRDGHDLTWAEAATLAVLPNSPSLVNTFKNPELLKEKRDKLLKVLYDRGKIDELTYELSVSEPIIEAARNMPNQAIHLTDYFNSIRQGERVITTIDGKLQEDAQDIVNSHQRILSNNLVENAAAIVVRVSDGAVLAYVGNSTLPDTSKNLGRSVDVIRSPRSTGSILKPFLYASMLSAGLMLPNQLLPDIPTRYDSFNPQNSDFSYSGAVPAGDALARSLNVPAVRMLRQYTEERFLKQLKDIGLTTFNKSADYYGLSLILGGGEATLFELAGAYASMARVANKPDDSREYILEDWHQPVFEETTQTKATNDPYPPLSAAAIWLTYEALRRVNRPDTEAGWQYFGSIPNLAWKTGTSYGSRDAWAIGTTPDYVVAVWAGNASGEGRPGLSGVGSAAPIMFDIIRALPSTGWFEQPLSEMTTTQVCAHSGYKAGPDCSETIEEWIPVAGLMSDACPYHQIIQLDKTETYRVNVDCVDPSEIVIKSWFVLPPAMEYYYKQVNGLYQTLPPMMPGCKDTKEVVTMEFIYPAIGTTLVFPKNFTGEKMGMLAEVAHRKRNTTLFWHLDNNYIGSTKSTHKIELSATIGQHVLTVTDEEGNTISRSFTVK